MSFDGKWEMEISSPMGAQKATCEFKVEGNKLTGTQSSPQGSTEVEGTVDGNKATWSASVKMPFPMKLEFDVTEDGDALSGTVKAGAFGKFPVKASRA